ncbi:hypothetical protein HDG35_006309 [Paraburkholderia sp. JPY681]|nr:hypothetical protein [Paraburkholderia atlantica]
MVWTNWFESTFATVRDRTTRTRNCVSRPTFLGLAFKLIEEAEKTWRRINGPEKIKLLLEGIAFGDGVSFPRFFAFQRPRVMQPYPLSAEPQASLA